MHPSSSGNRGNHAGILVEPECTYFWYTFLQAKFRPGPSSFCSSIPMSSEPSSTTVAQIPSSANFCLRFPESHGTGTSMTQGLGCHRGDSEPPPHLVNDLMQYTSFISNRNCIFTWFTSCCYVRLMLYETYNNVFFPMQVWFLRRFPKPAT